MYSLFVVGFVSILGQVVILRELSVAFYGVELIYTLALGIWLLFSACGAMISRKIQNPPPVRIKLLFLILSIGIPLDAVFIRAIRLIFSNIPGAFLPLHMQIGVLAVSLLPLGLLLGLLFQWTAKVYVAKGKSLATAYAIECLGGLAGGICSTFFLKLGFSNFVIVLICALSVAVFACFGAIGNWEKRLRPISVVMSIFVILLLWKAPMLDRLMTSWTHPNLVETQDSPYSRITVTRLNGQISIFENDALLFDTEGNRAEEFAHLAAVQHPRPEKILILGGGIEGTIREALLHSPLTVDYVELNPVLLDIARRNLPPELLASLQNENVRIIVEDPRRFLDRSLSYDLILVGMPEPASGQANRFYTDEFFRKCHAKLNEGGVIAFRLQSSENIWTPQLTRRMLSIYRAVKSAFPEVIFIPGTSNVVVASAGELAKDASVPASRFSARKIGAKLVSPDYIRYLYTNDRFQEVNRTLQSGIAPVNTDTRPICYQYTVLIWLSKFLPHVGFMDLSFAGSWIGWGAVSLLALFLAALFLHRARWPIRRALLMGIAAFAGMVLETILILHFQTKTGILYQDIGILLMSFMAGMALGAQTEERIRRSFFKWSGVALLLGFLLLSAATGLEINFGGGAGLFEVSVLLVLSGFFVGAVFAYASFRDVDDQRSIVAPLYAADLIGGCLGSILATLLLAPIAGLAISAYLMVPLILLAALLL